ncbi:hypothetical protein [Segetibacter sp. 3557_3]|uniref:hypothetical protein n=1 Tax=Segetibacter sp. 3557_3 TaxID=2547429 RepID=UPI00140509F0|nr:hypothetical protein [Segetibacter sp. 3557_3]
MNWLLIAILVLLVMSVIGLLVKQLFDRRKDRKIFDEYLENQRTLKFHQRTRNSRH